MAAILSDDWSGWECDERFDVLDVHASAGRETRYDSAARIGKEILAFGVISTSGLVFSPQDYSNCILWHMSVVIGRRGLVGKGKRGKGREKKRREERSRPKNEGVMDRRNARHSRKPKTGRTSKSAQGEAQEYHVSEVPHPTLHTALV